MATAIYHTDSGQKEQRLDVLDTNPDGTVNLGHKGAGEKGADVLVIGKCRVLKEPAVGSCVLEQAVPEAKEPPKDPAPATPTAKEPPKDPPQPAARRRGNNT